MDPTWMPVIVALIGGIFSVLGVVVTVLLNKYVKDDQMRKVLETALQNGLGVLQQAAKDGILDNDLILRLKPNYRLACHLK
jgi:hypothetical protein